MPKTQRFINLNSAVGLVNAREFDGNSVSYAKNSIHPEDECGHRKKSVHYHGTKCPTESATDFFRFTGALIFGDEVLLGSVPMEDMDVLVSPAKQAIIVSPESTNIAMSVVKTISS